MSLVEQLAQVSQAGFQLSVSFKDALALQQELISQGIVKKRTYDLPMLDVAAGPPRALSAAQIASKKIIG